MTCWYAAFDFQERNTLIELKKLHRPIPNRPFLKIKSLKKKSTECVLRTQGALSKYNVRLHKITSNSPDVLRNFPEQDLSKTSATTFGSSQQTLGLTWEITDDKLVVNSLVPDKPFTKRGVLAVVNSIFDLLGFVTPVILTGTLLQRQLITSKENSNPKVYKFSWDDDLPAEYAGAWSKLKIQEELTFSTI